MVPGDTLWSIARTSGELNNPLLWPVIYRNNTVIENPELISIGQTLTIKPPTPDEMREAIRYSVKRLKAPPEDLNNLDVNYKGGNTGR